MSRPRLRTAAGYLAVIVIAALAGGFLGSKLHDTKIPLMSDSEVSFAQMMMTHHQQALTLTDLLTPNAAPEVRALAEQIKFAQQTEIGTMIGWLQLAGQPLNPTVTMPKDLTDSTHSGQAGADASSHHEMGHAGGMGKGMGMASDDELRRLSRATGRDNEALFLQLMTRHHQGGIDMAAEGSRTSTNENIQRTAFAMVNEQGQELLFMRRLLADRNAPPLPYP